MYLNNGESQKIRRKIQKDERKGSVNKYNVLRNELFVHLLTKNIFSTIYFKP